MEKIQLHLRELENQTQKCYSIIEDYVIKKIPFILQEYFGLKEGEHADIIDGFNNQRMIVKNQKVTISINKEEFMSIGIKFSDIYRRKDMEEFIDGVLLNHYFCCYGSLIDNEKNIRFCVKAIKGFDNKALIEIIKKPSPVFSEKHFGQFVIDSWLR